MMRRSAAIVACCLMALSWVGCDDRISAEDVKAKYRQGAKDPAAQPERPDTLSDKTQDKSR